MEASLSCGVEDVLFAGMLSSDKGKARTLRSIWNGGMGEWVVRNFDLVV